MWTVQMPSDNGVFTQLLNHGSVLTIDIDPRGPTVVFAARQPGLGSPLVGQQVIVRRWLTTEDGAPLSEDEVTVTLRAAVDWLHGPDATESLRQVSSGYRCERLWSGDELGEWSPEAWQAAESTINGIIHAMETAQPA